LKYALLVYEAPDPGQPMPTEHRRVMHQDYHAAAARPEVTAHYRVRPPNTAVTVRVEDGATMLSDGPRDETGERVRAIYLVESDSRETVLELAAGIPAARKGGAVEIWPLSEPPVTS
jgi:hypothetical protein